MFKAIDDFFSFNSFSYFNSELLKRIQDNDPTLITLDLHDRNLNNKNMVTLCTALRGNTTLKELNLGRNKIGDAGAKALAQNTTLTTLDLEDNKISAAGASALAKNTTLTTLDLNSNRIGDAGASALAKNNTLTTLNLNKNHISPEGAIALAKNTTLTTLNLEHNQIGDAGASALAKNTTLTTLKLWQNQIGSEGAIALAKNTSLTTLDLEDNKISAAGAIALANNTTLTILNLSYNQIGDAGAIVLAKNTSLTTLGLWGNEIGAAAEEAIKAMLERNRAQKKGSIDSATTLTAPSTSSQNPSAWTRLTSLFSASSQTKTTPAQATAPSSHSLPPEEKPGALPQSPKPATEVKTTPAAKQKSPVKTPAPKPQPIPEPPPQPKPEEKPQTPAQQWATWAHQPQSAPAPDFLASLPKAAQADVTVLTQGEKETLLVRISTLQQAQAGLEQRLAGTLKAEAEDANQKQAIQTINANPNTQAYFEALLRVIDQTLLASLVIGSGAVARAEDPVAQNLGERLLKGASVVTGIVFPPVAPILSLISHMMSTADNINSVREIHRLSSWVSSSGDIPAFTLTLAIALTQTQEQAIKQNQHPTQNQGKLNQIRHHCKLLLKQLKVGESFTKAKEHAILDAYALLDYMMGKKPNDAAQDAKVNELIIHLTGSAPTATQQATGASTSSSSTATPVLVMSKTEPQAPAYDPAKEIEALKERLAAQDAKSSTHEAKLAAQEAELKKLREQSQHNNHDDEVDYGDGTKGIRAQQTLNTRKGPVPVEHAIKQQESKHVALEQRVQEAEHLLVRIAETQGVTAFQRPKPPSKDDKDELLGKKDARSSRYQK